MITLKNPFIREYPPILSTLPRRVVDYGCPTCWAMPFKFCTDNGVESLSSHNNRSTGPHWTAIQGAEPYKDKFSTWDSWPMIADRHNVSPQEAKALVTAFDAYTNDHPTRWPRPVMAARAFRRVQLGSPLESVAAYFNWTEKKTRRAVKKYAQDKGLTTPAGAR